MDSFIPSPFHYTSNKREKRLSDLEATPGPASQATFFSRIRAVDHGPHPQDLYWFREVHQVSDVPPQDVEVP